MEHINYRPELQVNTPPPIGTSILVAEARNELYATAEKATDTIQRTAAEAASEMSALIAENPLATNDELIEKHHAAFNEHVDRALESPKWSARERRALEANRPSADDRKALREELEKKDYYRYSQESISKEFKEKVTHYIRRVGNRKQDGDSRLTAIGERVKEDEAVVNQAPISRLGKLAMGRSNKDQLALSQHRLRQTPDELHTTSSRSNKEIKTEVKNAQEAVQILKEWIMQDATSPDKRYDAIKEDLRKLDARMKAALDSARYLDEVEERAASQLTLEDIFARLIQSKGFTAHSASQHVPKQQSTKSPSEQKIDRELAGLSGNELKRKYRQLAKEFHPDTISKESSVSAEEAAQAIRYAHQAYEEARQKAQRQANKRR